MGFHGLVGAFLQAHCFFAVNEANTATEAKVSVFTGTLLPGLERSYFCQTATRDQVSCMKIEVTAACNAEVVILRFLGTLDNQGPIQ